jgi:hypothetical protein
MGMRCLPWQIALLVLTYLFHLWADVRAASAYTMTQ